MNIRTVNDSDGPVLRDLHLRMYTDSPTAFGETLEAVRGMSGEQWHARAQEYSHPDKAQAWIALEQNRTIGFMAGYIGQFRDDAVRWDVTDVVTLARAWIDPSMRRRGIGRVLAKTVMAWANEHGAKTLEAQVTENNTRAIEFYGALGFVDTGHREPLRSNRSLSMYFLYQSLCDDVRPAS